jgi:uncharacterized protein YjbI with pentapeptide repeats
MQCTDLQTFASDIDTTVFNNTMPQAVNFTFADLYSNTHPSSLGMSGEPANFEPADLCSATHTCSLNTAITTVSLRANNLCSFRMILLTANLGPADLCNEVHLCSHGTSSARVNWDQ